jgi:hypothetical protein
MELAFDSEGRGEAQRVPSEGTEPFTAERGTESRASAERLMS